MTPRNGPSRRSPLSPSPVRIRSTIATIVDKPEDLRELRIVHKALADVNRLRIVRRLAGGSASVRELIEEVGLSQPLVSWHIVRLRTAGLVATRRNGRETICSLRRDAFESFVARERVILGLSGESPPATAVAEPAIAGGPPRRVAAS